MFEDNTNHHSTNFTWCGHYCSTLAIVRLFMTLQVLSIRTHPPMKSHGSNPNKCHHLFRRNCSTCIIMSSGWVGMAQAVKTVEAAVVLPCVTKCRVTISVSLGDAQQQKWRLHWLNLLMDVADDGKCQPKTEKIEFLRRTEITRISNVNKLGRTLRSSTNIRHRQSKLSLFRYQKGKK